MLATLSVARTRSCGDRRRARELLRAGARHEAGVVEVALEERDADDTPLTVGSVAWNVKSAVDELLSVAGVVSKAEVGPVLSTEYTAPVKLPLAAPVPPSLLPAASTIESLSTRLRPSVPSPEPVDAVTT